MELRGAWRVIQANGGATVNTKRAACIGGLLFFDSTKARRYRGLDRFQGTTTIRVNCPLSTASERCSGVLASSFLHGLKVGFGVLWNPDCLVFQGPFQSLVLKFTKDASEPEETGGQIARPRRAARCGSTRLRGLTVASVFGPVVARGGTHQWPAPVGPLWKAPPFSSSTCPREAEDSRGRRRAQLRRRLHREASPERAQGGGPQRAHAGHAPSRHARHEMNDLSEGIEHATTWLSMFKT